MKGFFQVKKYSPADKWIEVEGPDLSIRVDYDDVDHRTVRKSLAKMVRILNERWGDLTWQELAKEEIQALKRGRENVLKRTAAGEPFDEPGDDE